MSHENFNTREREKEAEMKAQGIEIMPPSTPEGIREFREASRGRLYEELKIEDSLKSIDRKIKDEEAIDAIRRSINGLFFVKSREMAGKEGKALSPDYRRQHEKFDNYANSKNDRRKWYEKILGLKKTGGKDIAKEFTKELDDYIAQETGGDKSKEEEALGRWEMLHSSSEDISKGYYRVQAEDYSTVRDKLVKITDGRLSFEQINHWPEVQEAARGEIGRRSKIDYNHKFKDFLSTRDKWVEAGVITKEEANRLPEVQENAKREIEIKSKRNKSDLEESIKNWVDVGVLDEVTARAWAKKFEGSPI